MAGLSDNKETHSILDGVFNAIEEHPKEAGAGAGLTIFGLISLNIVQWIKGKKQSKIFEETTELQKEAILKQDAVIKDLSKSAAKVKQLEIVNDALMQVIDDGEYKGDKAGEQE